MYIYSVFGITNSFTKNKTNFGIIIYYIISKNIIFIENGVPLSN